ncbi:hypothetical protein IV60_GL001423 [Lancefieldella rimae]|nr:hypothetical protein IV60_GL001423 [Lancefieldella rimae]
MADDLSDKETIKLHNLVRKNPHLKDLVKLISEIQGKSVFLSGPITGVDGYKDRFADAAEVIKALGANTVFNPAAEIPDNTEREEAMRICTGKIITSDCVITLPGWQDSEGACFEYVASEICGITHYELKELITKSVLQQIKEDKGDSDDR